MQLLNLATLSRQKHDTMDRPLHTVANNKTSLAELAWVRVPGMNGTTATATAYRYITRQPGVRGGNAGVEGTRIGVHDVIGLLQNGETVDTVISRCFPDLTRAQVYECLAYYEDHRGEIDLLVARQMAEPTP